MYSRCAIKFNDVEIDKEINGYMTVNVEGRQLFSPTLETLEVPGRNGDICIGKQYSSRDIKVYFLIEAERNVDFLKKIKRLTEILQTTNEVEFKFRDEDGVRFGQVSEVEDPPYDSNIGIGSFTIHSSDPFLYTNIKQSNGIIPTLKYKKYPIKIESLEVTGATTSSLQVLNKSNGKKIIINEKLVSTDKVLITKDTITKNGNNILNKLDFVTSDYHEFEVYSGEAITVSSGNVTVNYRERVL